MTHNLVALVYGSTGQDGSYLIEFLLEKGYTVHGVIRRSSNINTQRIDHIYQDSHTPNARLKLHYGDLTDANSITALIHKIHPDEIYNLGAMSHVKISFEIPEYTTNVDALGTLHILEAIRTLPEDVVKPKYYQAGTSELFGGVSDTPNNELTPFNPRSPYAVAKLYAHWITRNYREAYGLYAVNGILHNHTSPRRGHNFVEQKIVRAAVRIKYGMEKCLYLGNLNAKRDIGHAKDYISAIYLMMHNTQPKDYVVATGKTYSVRSIVETVFEIIGMPILWVGEGINEMGVTQNTAGIVVRVDERYFRPTEVDVLLGDASKIKEELEWCETYTLRDILEEMVSSETSKLRQNKNLA